MKWHTQARLVKAWAIFTTLFTLLEAPLLAWSGAWGSDTEHNIMLFVAFLLIANIFVFWIFYAKDEFNYVLVFTAFPYITLLLYYKFGYYLGYI